MASEVLVPPAPSHVSDELITAAGYRRDVAMFAARLAKRAAQHGDDLRQVIFFDERIRPDGAHELVFAEHQPIVFDEVGQRLERLRQQRHGRAVVAQQQAPAAIEAEGAKLVRERRSVAHSSLISSQKVSERSKNVAFTIERS